MPASVADVSTYRLAPGLVARLLGSLLVLLALAIVLVTVVLLAAGAGSDAVLVVGGCGVLVAVAAGWWLRSGAYVVRLDAEGYRVGLARGAGVRRGAWPDVAEAVATSSGGDPCVVLRRRDGGSTTVPVRLLAGDREEFARDVRDRLRDHGLPQE